MISLAAEGRFEDLIFTVRVTVFAGDFRVLRLAGAFAVVVLEGVAVGINSLVACLLNHYKRKWLTFLPTLQNRNKMKQLLQPF